MLTDAIDLSQLRRVLVIKLRHHGDALLTSPVFSVLKNHAPHLKIDALVYQDTAEMLTLHPAIEEIHTIDRAWKRAGLLSQASVEKWLREQLREQRVDELFSAMDRMASVVEPAPMSPEEMAQEIAAMRNERRANRQL